MKNAVSFQCSGNIYQLRFDINSLCVLEELINKPMSQLAPTDTGVRELRYMFFAGIIPKMSLEDAGNILTDLVSEQGMNEVQKIISKAMDLSLSGGNNSNINVKKKE